MEEIINNVMQSPENTNPNVLRSQLNTIQRSGSSSGGLKIIEGELVYVGDKPVPKLPQNLEPEDLAGSVVHIDYEVNGITQTLYSNISAVSYPIENEEGVIGVIFIAIGDGMRHYHQDTGMVDEL